MIQKNVEIKNRLGMHARPAAQFVKTATKFTSDVFVGRNEHEVNGKSIMGVMMLAAEQGSFLTLTVNGEDEEAAMQALVELIERKFDEE
ncbi:MAG TPA: HPr family phosphocarrier protein [bacterium]|jgi:phosphocarrier protein